MNQNRKRDTDMPNRSSETEPAEGSRETVRNSRNDLGSSSDRAMFDERMRSGEQNKPGDGRSNTGGITNRPLDREQSEQEQLPARGRAKSEE